MLSAVFLALVPAPSTEAQAVYALAERLLGPRARVLKFVHQRELGDRYRATSPGEEILIVGGTGSAMARGLYAALSRDFSIGLIRGAPYPPSGVYWDGVTIRDSWHQVGDFAGRARTPHRRYLSEETYRQSIPFWGWREWEREIDWMALHGLNEPLALVGQEVVWRELWREEGLTDQDSRVSWPTPGEALPSEDWLRRRADLQRKVLGRLRSLGLRPILPEFKGLVPRAWAAKNAAGATPNLLADPTKQLLQIQPSSPHYSRLRSRFVELYRREYGYYESASGDGEFDVWKIAGTLHTRLGGDIATLVDEAATRFPEGLKAKSPIALVAPAMIGPSPMFYEYATRELWSTDRDYGILLDRSYLPRWKATDSLDSNLAWLEILDTFHTHDPVGPPWRYLAPPNRSAWPISATPGSARTALIILNRLDTGAFANRTLYDRDTIDVAKEVIGEAIDLALANAVREAKFGLDRRHESIAFELMEGLDGCLATVEGYRLTTWMEHARRSGSPEDRDALERAARSALIRDGIPREWSGLLRHYHVPRWRHYLSRVADGNLSPEDVEREFRTLEDEWIRSGRTDDVPVADVRAELRRLIELAKTVEPLP